MGGRGGGGGGASNHKKKSDESLFMTNVSLCLKRTEKNEAVRTVKVTLNTKKTESKALREACKATFWPTSGSEGEFWIVLGS